MLQNNTKSNLDEHYIWVFIVCRLQARKCTITSTVYMKSCLRLFFTLDKTSLVWLSWLIAQCPLLTGLTRFAVVGLESHWLLCLRFILQTSRLFVFTDITRCTCSLQFHCFITEDEMLVLWAWTLTVYLHVQLKQTGSYSLGIRHHTFYSSTEFKYSHPYSILRVYTCEKWLDYYNV